MTGAFLKRPSPYSQHSFILLSAKWSRGLFQELHMWRGIARLGVAAAGIAAAIFSVCAAGVALAPPATKTVLGDLVHAELGSLPQSVTGGRFIASLLIWTVGSALVVVVAAWVSERLYPREPAPPVLRPRLTVATGGIRRLDDRAPAGGHDWRTARAYRPATITGGLYVTEPSGRPRRRPAHRGG
jgi:hypothetical protein